MLNIKHVGRYIGSGRKCLVAYRTIPNDAYNCLVVPTESLDQDQHDSLIRLVESNASQVSYEFAEVLARNLFPDGTNMLTTLHRKGLLVKVPTDKIEMIPNTQTKITLADLNQMIAEQRGVSVQDLALQDNSRESAKELSVKEEPNIGKLITPIEDSNLDAEDQARQFRSEADKLSKQAAELRRKAEELVPIKRPAKKT